MCSPLKGFRLIVPLKATRDSQRFRLWLHSVQFDSEVWCTLPKLTQWWEAHRGAWLRGGIHTAEVFEKFDHLTPRCDAHHGAWFRGGMHTAQLDSAVGCKLRSQTNSNMSVFRVFAFVTSFDSVFWKNFYSKKDSLNNLWLTVLFSY